MAPFLLVPNKWRQMELNWRHLAPRGADSFDAIWRQMVPIGAKILKYCVFAIFTTWRQINGVNKWLQ